MLMAMVFTKCEMRGINIMTEVNQRDNYAHRGHKEIILTGKKNPKMKENYH